MSEEEGEPKPKRLRLSKSAGSGNKVPGGTTPPEAPPPSSEESAPKPPMALPSSSKHPPAGDLASKAPALKPGGAPKPETPPKQPPPLPKVEASPPPIQSPTPPPSPTSATSLDQAIDQIEAASQEKSPFASIVIMLALLTIFGGGGYGIWYVLAGTSPENPSSSEAEVATDSAKATRSDSNPVQKAQAIISAVTTAGIDEVLKDASDTFETATKSSTTSTAEQKEISDFLTNAQYGGVRSGPKARVVINGESYHIDDEIYEIVGLIFVGTKDGQLVFRDKNGIVYTKRF